MEQLETGSKHCVVVNFCAIHLPGINALLNSLDLYENNMDVVLIYESTGESKVPDEYIDKVKSTDWRFRVHFYKFEELLERYNVHLYDKFQNATFIGYYLMKDLPYETMSYWGGDMCVVNNIEKWYEIAHKTSLIVTAHSACVQQPYEFNEHTKDLSFVWDTPFIFRKDLDILDKIISYQDTHNNMQACNKVLMETGLMERVLDLPDIQWCSEAIYLYRMERHTDSQGRPTLWANKERVNAIHKKWWLSGWTNGYTHDKDQHAKDNAKLLGDIYRILNTIGKLKYDY